MIVPVLTPSSFAALPNRVALVSDINNICRNHTAMRSFGEEGAICLSLLTASWVGALNVCRFLGIKIPCEGSCFSGRKGNCSEISAIFMTQNPVSTDFAGV